MNYVVTILTEKYLYRVNIEGGIKYTLGSGKKDLFPMSELGIDGQLGMCFNEKKQVLKLTAKTIPLSVKEINEEARLVHICGYPKIEVSFTRDTGEYPESYAIPYECQIHIGRSKKNDIVLNESYVSRNHLLITAEKGRIRIEDLESTYGTYLNGSPVKKAMLKSGDEIDICDLRMICKENRLYFYNLHETPEFKYQKEINHPGMATDIVSTRKGYPIYHRSPRIRESLPVDEVRLSHLPNKPQKFSIRKANFLPLLSSGAMAGASIAMSTFSPAMLAMRAAMMISPVGSLIGNSNKKARKMLMVEEEERFRKYADYIAGEKALLDYLEVRESITPIAGHEHALFYSIQRKRMGVQAVENLVKKYAQHITSTKKITPHKLRSTYGTALYRETGDIYLVADVLGHKDVNTTRKHYASVGDEQRRKAASALRLREEPPKQN